MRKLVAIIVCWLLAFSIGYTILPTGFSAVINWLGPVFGTSIHLIFSTLFVLLADPLKYTSLAIAWAIVGFIGGLIIRKRISSVLTMLSVYSAQAIVIVLGGFRIYQTISSLGILTSPQNALALLPPVPEGSSLGTILSAPVIGDIYNRVPWSSLQSITPNFIIDVLLQTIILSLAKNLLILCVSALIGCEIGKLLTRPFKPKLEAIRMKYAPVPANPSPISSKVFLGFLLSLIIVVAFTPAVMIGKASPASYYSETLVETVTPNGTAVFLANFFDNQYILQGVDLTNQAFRGCLVASLVAQKLDLTTISQEISAISSQVPIELRGVISQALGLYQLLPPTLLVLVYNDTAYATSALDRASQAANLFSSKFGIQLTMLISMEQPINGRSFTIAVYQSDASFQTLSTKIMNTLPESQRDGLASYVGSVFRAGTLTPGQTILSANGTVIATGFIDYSTIKTLVTGGNISTLNPFMPTIGGPVPMISIASYLAGRFHSSPIVLHSLKFNDLLNTTAPLKFSPTTNASTILSVIPMGNTTTPGEFAAPIIKMATTLPIENITALVNSVLQAVTGTTMPSGQIPSSLVNLVVTQIVKGGTVDPNVVAAIFSFRFPMTLKVVKSVSVKEIDRHQRVTVTVTVLNDDTDAADNLSLDDSAILSYYSQSVKLVSGTLTKSWSNIPNGTQAGPSTRSYSYDLQLDEEGVYTLPIAMLKYVYKGSEYWVYSNQVAVKVRSPSLLQVLVEGSSEAWVLAVKMINMVPQAGGNGSTILMAVLAVLLILIVLNEYRGFRKWVKQPTTGKK